MMAKKSRFKIKATSDFGRELYLDMVVSVLKQRQSNMIVHEVTSKIEAQGRPIQNIARVEIPDEIELEDMKEWVLDSLRLFYGGPPFVIMIEEDDEPLPGIEDGGGISLIEEPDGGGSIIDDGGGSLVDTK